MLERTSRVSTGIWFCWALIGCFLLNTEGSRASGEKFCYMLSYFIAGKVPMLADICGDFAKATDLTQEKDKTVLGSVRNQRFSILVEDVKTVKVNIEPD